MEALIAWLSANWQGSGLVVAAIVALWSNKEALAKWLPKAKGGADKVKAELEKLKAKQAADKGDPVKQISNILESAKFLHDSGALEPAEDLVTKVIPAIGKAVLDAKAKTEVKP